MKFPPPPWVLHTLATMVLWGGWGALSKPLSENLPPAHVQALSTVGVLPVLALLARRRPSASPTARRGMWQAFVAGLITGVGNIACFAALAAGGPAAAVVPVTALYPVVTIALAIVFLGERFNRIQALGLALSLVAILLLNVPPEGSLLSPWLATALVPIGLWGVSALVQKLATRHIDATGATFAFLAGFLPIAILTLVLQPASLMLPGPTWLLLAGLGLCFAVGNLTLLHAYASGGPASIVTPLASLYAIVTIPLAIVAFHERVGVRETAGIALALAAIAALTRDTPPPDQTPTHPP